MAERKPKKKKAGFTREDWPEKGRVNERGYCVDCKTYWCPHAKPEMYTR
jgi:hypothetical protein